MSVRSLYGLVLTDAACGRRCGGGRIPHTALLACHVARCSNRAVCSVRETTCEENWMGRPSKMVSASGSSSAQWVRTLHETVMSESNRLYPWQVHL